MHCNLYCVQPGGHASRAQAFFGISGQGVKADLPCKAGLRPDDRSAADIVPFSHQLRLCKSKCCLRNTGQIKSLLQAEAGSASLAQKTSLHSRLRASGHVSSSPCLCRGDHKQYTSETSL
jgi:hypothetical protein